jgi:alkylation response protein AidB-like acyl-CoA dehydrogenase
MLLELTAEQCSLRDLTRDFLSRRLPEAALRTAMSSEQGFDDAIWAELGSDLGLCGLGIPDEYGGADGGPIELAVVMHELGRIVAPLPFLSSVVLASTVLMQSGDRAACERLLPNLASGQTRGALALVEPGWRWDPAKVATTAVQEGREWRVTGEKSFVVDGATADVILLSANTPAGAALFEVEASAERLARHQMSTIDQTRKLAHLDLKGTPARQIGTAGLANDVIERTLVLANICLAAESVGGAEYVLETSVAYAGLREQFGRRIGTFQAIKHKCADMFVDIESARSAVESAVAVAHSRRTDVASHASIAASLCHDAFLRCASENVQIHGGIGFTWEHSAHLYFKRAQANRVLFGDGVHHRRSLAITLGI